MHIRWIMTGGMRRDVWCDNADDRCKINCDILTVSNVYWSQYAALLNLGLLMQTGWYSVARLPEFT